jgi:molybdopterin/thiamine biosynthesis adenylyltransferase
VTIVLGDESRYDRQQRITWWDQHRLVSSRVLVVGAGALGNEVVKNLVLMGVGSILVVDFDVVEASNLARCVFFRDGDDGRRKVDALCERAAELNADVDLVGTFADVRSLGTGIAYRADVMVGALDNREARLYLNRLAWRAGRAWVDGAIEGLFGAAKVFAPPTGCYECTLSEADFAAIAHRQSCRLLSRDEMALGRTPTTATAASIIGGLQAQEVVKLLHRDRPGVTPLHGGMIFDGANNDAYPLRYPLSEDCLAHHVFETPIRVEAGAATTFRQLAATLGLESAVIELGDDHVLTWICPRCDVRSPAGHPVPLVSLGDATCVDCGEARQFVSVASIAVPSEHADLTLAQVGIRPDEVLAVRHGSDYQYAWLSSSDHLPKGWA